MKITNKLIISGIVGFIGGYVLQKYVGMLYFAGILASFIMLFGQTQQQIKQIDQPKRQEEDPRNKMMVIGLIGYLLAGVLLMF